MTQNIAIYWDFENIHASLCKEQRGPGWYRDNRYVKQPALVDVGALMSYISRYGRIKVNRAYGHWRYFSAYDAALLEHTVDLVQILPRGIYGKNGADIRLAVDAVEDMARHPHLDLFVVVSGDSDYISVAQKARQLGKTIYGIGVKESSNPFWMKACDHFATYGEVIAGLATAEPALQGEAPSSPGVAAQAPPEAPPRPGAGDGPYTKEQARALLVRTLRLLTQRTREPAVLKAMLKPAMLNEDRNFHEAKLGYSSFNAFLADCDDLIEVRPGAHDLQVSLRSEPPAAPGLAVPAGATYEFILRKQNLRLPEPAVLRNGILYTFLLFKHQAVMPSFDEYKARLIKLFALRGEALSDADASKIKTLLYRAYAFYLRPEKDGVMLQSEIRSAQQLLRRVYGMLVKRILEHSSEAPDRAELARLLFGPAPDGELLDLLIKDARG